MIAAKWDYLRSSEPAKVMMSTHLWFEVINCIRKACDGIRAAAVDSAPRKSFAARGISGEL
jgi:hypothetical protein